MNGVYANNHDLNILLHPKQALFSLTRCIALFVLLPLTVIYTLSKIQFITISSANIVLMVGNNFTAYLLIIGLLLSSFSSVASLLGNERILGFALRGLTQVSFFLYAVYVAGRPYTLTTANAIQFHASFVALSAIAGVLALLRIIPASLQYVEHSKSIKMKLKYGQG